MATLQELEEKINHLESELYETKMIAYSSFKATPHKARLAALH